MGEAVQTEFTKGYVQQSIVLVEEIDRSEATALIALNAAMANKIMDTPVIGMIEQHPLCTIIATANTAGVGATEEYITANQLDASTRDRFIYISMEFDDKIATKIAKGDKERLADVVLGDGHPYPSRAYGDACTDLDVQRLPADVQRLAQLLCRHGECLACMVACEPLRRDPETCHLYVRRVEYVDPPCPRNHALYNPGRHQHPPKK